MFVLWVGFLSQPRAQFHHMSIVSECFPSVTLTSRGKVMIKVSMKRCALRRNCGFNFRSKWKIKEGQMESSKLSE